MPNSGVDVGFFSTCSFEAAFGISVRDMDAGTENSLTQLQNIGLAEKHSY